MLIEANIFNYDQIQNTLEAKENVKIDDKIENYILETEYLNYDRNSEIIFTKGLTRVILENNYEFNTKDIFLNKKLKELKSDNKSTIKDDDFNLYRLSKFLYFYEKKLLRGNNIEIETNHQSENSDKFYLKTHL